MPKQVLLTQPRNRTLPAFKEFVRNAARNLGVVAKEGEGLTNAEWATLHKRFWASAKKAQ